MGVNWTEWGRTAFAQAKQQDKPIILDIFGAWCHWCHRIDKDTYENPEIAQLINDSFIPVRVDTDKRPDINERYNQGGWPSTCFLTPDGEIIAGGTYIPPQQMKKIIPQVLEFYRKNKPALKQGLASDIDERPHAIHVLDKTIIANIADYLTENFDSVHGGFYTEPKFPMPDAVELAFLLYSKTGDRKFLRTAEVTLEGMRPLYDSVEGGFFRYSVTHDWKEPHYEKMLETNARLLENYLHGYEATKNEAFRRIAAGIADYVLANLWSGSAFYGSQDADGEKEYYGKSLEERQKMEKPSVDKTVYVNLNGIAIAAFLEAARVLGESKCNEAALAATDFILEKCYDGLTVCHYYDGEPRVHGLLSDNVYFVIALLRAHKATGGEKYLRAAEKIMNYLLRNFRNGAFYDKEESIDDAGLLKQKIKPFQENCSAALALLELHKVTKKEEYKKAAEDVLSYFSEDYRIHGVQSAFYAVALSDFLEG